MSKAKGRSSVSAAAKQTGRNFFLPALINYMQQVNTVKKIQWVEGKKKNSLTAVCDNGLNEKDIDPIQQWCEEHHCGQRTSFDTFQFQNKKDITMFLLRWG